MVTLNEDLATSADAHELVADLSKARAGVAGSGKCENCAGQKGGVESAA